MKRQATDLEKTFVKFFSDKGFLSRIFKELSKFNQMKTENQILKMGKKYEHTFY